MRGVVRLFPVEIGVTTSGFTSGITCLFIVVLVESTKLEELGVVVVEFVVTEVVIGLTEVDVDIPFPVDVELGLTVVFAAILVELEVESEINIEFTCLCSF